MVTDSQVRRLFAMKNKCRTLYQLADKAGMSTKTARKYLKSSVLPSHGYAIPKGMPNPP
jgi:response regulator of citrate/malate metabolism